MVAVRAEDHIGLVKLLANGWAKRTGLDFDDLVQEGMFGLLRAIEKYDPDLGKFSNYAGWWINACISRGVRDRGRLVRLPHRQHDILRNRGESLPSTPMSLDANVARGLEHEEGVTYLDCLVDDSPDAEDVLGNKEEAKILWAAVDALPSRTRIILRMRFLQGLTLQQVAENFGLTRERIRQIEEKALASLAKALEKRL